jgi:hypothetical protein
MSLLRLLAIAVGILTVATRLPGVFWPKGYREKSLKLAGSDIVVRCLGALALGLGIVVVVALFKDMNWLEIALLVLALIWLPAGSVAAWRPDAYRRFATKVLLSGDLAVRLMCGLGAVVGFLLFFLGVFG